MKKILCIALTVLLTLTPFSIRANAEGITTGNLEKAAKIIDSANQKINKKIAKAVEDANTLVDWYKKEMAKVQPCSTLMKSSYDIENITVIINAEAGTYEIINGPAYIDSSCSLTVGTDMEKVRKINEKFSTKLDKIINKLTDSTNAIALKAIEKAADSGVRVECQLIQVNLADKVVLIDPLRIIDE